jgi:hypothetical protein
LVGIWFDLKLFLIGSEPEPDAVAGGDDDGSVGALGVESQPTRPVTTRPPAKSPTLENLLRRVVKRLPFSVSAGAYDHARKR